jgi:hypothetical protein
MRTTFESAIVVGLGTSRGLVAVGSRFAFCVVLVVVVAAKSKHAIDKFAFIRRSDCE